MVARLTGIGFIDGRVNLIYPEIRATTTTVIIIGAVNRRENGRDYSLA